MKHTHSFLAVAIAASIPTFASAATELTPNHFAYGMPLQLQGDAAIYMLTVPQAVYQHALRTDLGDLRIFNGDGEWVTYSVSTPLAKASRAALVTVPIFPLHGDPGRALDHVRITIASEQGAVNLQASRDVAPAQIQSYVIDARKLMQPVTALELRWPEAAAEFSGHIDIDSSDDLGTWLPVASHLPVVNLQFGDQTLLQNRLEFSPVKARYLRLRWLDRPAPFAINAMLAETAPTQTEPTREHAEVPGQPVADQTGTYDFALNLHAPIDRINLQLPQLNTIANVTLSSRSQSTQPWHDVTALRVYELQNNGTTLRNPTVMIAPNTDHYWRMQAHTAGGIGKGAPTLQVAWIPQEISFVARGRGPFQLAFGSVTANTATSSLQSLLADPGTPISIGKATAGPVHELGGVTQLAAKRQFPWKTWALWAALIAAVAALGTVAYRLSREMSK